MANQQNKILSTKERERERERERKREKKKKNTKLNTSLLGKQTLMKLKLNNNKNIHGNFQTDTRVARVKLKLLN